MLNRPFHDEIERSPRKSATEHFQRSNIDIRLMLTVKRMKVRRSMLAPKHLDNDAKTGLWLAWQLQTPFLLVKSYTATVAFLAYRL